MQLTQIIRVKLIRPDSNPQSLDSETRVAFAFGSQEIVIKTDIFDKA